MRRQEAVRLSDLGPVAEIVAAAVAARRGGQPGALIQCGPAVAEALGRAFDVRRADLPPGTPVNSLYGVPVEVRRHMGRVWRLTGPGGCIAAHGEVCGPGRPVDDDDAPACGASSDA
jgi:hypothetical protein